MTPYAAPADESRIRTKSDINHFLINHQGFGTARRRETSQKARSGAGEASRSPRDPASQGPGLHYREPFRQDQTIV